MFKNTDNVSKVVIAVLFLLLVLQSVGVYTLRNTIVKEVEVEAKICTAEDVACTRSDTLAAMVGADRPVYMCIQGTE